MYTAELYVKVRRAVMVEGKSECEVARLYGIYRQSVKKMCAYSAPRAIDDRRRRCRPSSRRLCRLLTSF